MGEKFAGGAGRRPGGEAAETGGARLPAACGGGRPAARMRGFCRAYEEGRERSPEGRERAGGRVRVVVGGGPQAPRRSRPNGRRPFARRRAAGGLRPGFCGLQGAAGGGKPPIG